MSRAVEAGELDAWSARGLVLAPGCTAVLVGIDPEQVAREPWFADGTEVVVASVIEVPEGESMFAPLDNSVVCQIGWLQPQWAKRFAFVGAHCLRPPGSQ